MALLTYCVRLQKYTWIAYVTNEFKIEHLGMYYISGGVQVSYLVDGVWPSTYLGFAKRDLEEAKTDRNFVNCVSNAKRAIHYQVDTLSKAFSFELSQYSKTNNFPSKYEFLKKCGVIAPRLMSRLNRLRNSIEHDYYIPSLEEAEEYVEIAELYLAATNQISINFPSYTSGDLMDDDEDYDSSLGLPSLIEIKIPEGQGMLEIFDGKNKLIEKNIQDHDYYDWVSCITELSVA